MKMAMPWTRRAALALALAVFCCHSAAAQLFETKAKEAFMIDAETGTVLYSKDANKLVPPASLAKLMTVEVVFHALEAGRLSLDDEFVVSEHAWREGGAGSGGSTMFAKLGSSIRVEDLIQGVIVQSANDGCIVLAEGIAGSEANFAALMTERAHKLGLKDLVFRNSTGLPAKGQVVTARELTLLALHLWRQYPQFYKYFAEPSFKWNNILQRNRNPLLTMGIGADGLKTGYTEESGYAIVGSVDHDGRRLFATMSGMGSAKEREEESRKMLEWGMRAFDKREIFHEGETVGRASVFGGEKSEVALRAKGPISIFVPIINRDKLTARIVYQGPLQAPVAEGARVGTLKVWIGDTLSQEQPLFAAEPVAVGSLQQRAVSALEELAVGWIR